MVDDDIGKAKRLGSRIEAKRQQSLPLMSIKPMHECQAQIGDQQCVSSCRPRFCNDLPLSKLVASLDCVNPGEECSLIYTLVQSNIHHSFIKLPSNTTANLKGLLFWVLPNQPINRKSR